MADFGRSDRNCQECSKVHYSIFGTDDCNDYDEISSDDDKDNGHNFQSYHSGLDNCSVLLVYLLGLSYHPTHDYTTRREDESRHLVWFTYRSDFEEIAPYGITSDAGYVFLVKISILCVMFI